MSAHQRYLEAPYERSARFDAAFEAWCEQEGRDLDDEEALIDFERLVDDWLD